MTEEPQGERGEPGSRDTGSDEPAGGPVDRPSGTAEEDSESSVDAKGATDDDMPQLPTSG